jgi:hypothetical protein
VANGKSASAASVVSCSTSVTMVNTQVAAMLNTIGGGLQHNELLRMMIALMILQALLSQDGGNQKAAMEGMMELFRAATGQRTTTVSLHSATNVVQLEQQSTVLMTGQAALAPTTTEGDPNSSGDQIDISA